MKPTKNINVTYAGGKVAPLTLQNRYHIYYILLFSTVYIKIEENIEKENTPDSFKVNTEPF